MATVLNADAIGHLRALGQALWAAPPGQHQGATIELVVRTATQYRSDGAAWPDIARALGIDENQLRQWRRSPDHKPIQSRSPSPTPPAMLGTAESVPGLSTTGSILHSQSVTISQRSNQSQFANSGQTSRFTGQTGLAQASRARRVLVVSGDTRPGGNDFSLEAAEVRQSLVAALVDVRELGSVELSELSYHVDDQRPAVLHVCAHSAFGGVYLPLRGEPSAVAHSTVWETISATRRPPRLVVLNLCQWPAALHGPSPTGVETLICWPAMVDDEQARLFSRLLYTALAMNRTIGAAFTTALRTVCNQWSSLEPPTLHGNGEYSIF